MGSNKTTEKHQQVATTTTTATTILINNSKKVSKYLQGSSSSSSSSNDRWLKKLQKEYHELKRQVINLASFNYAREPDFVRDRNKLRDTLDEVSDLKRTIQTKYVDKILDKLERAQEKIDQDARRAEEKSERMAKDFLDGIIRHDDFLDRYINVRKNAIQKRIIADKLVKERGKLDDNVASCAAGSSKNKNNRTVDQQNSPTPTPRQRKRLSLVTNQ